MIRYRSASVTLADLEALDRDDPLLQTAAWDRPEFKPRQAVT